MVKPGADTIKGTNSLALGLSLKWSIIKGRAGNIEIMANIGKNADTTIIIPCGIFSNRPKKAFIFNTYILLIIITRNELVEYTF